MNDLSDSFYGWTFEGRDVSQKTAQEYPRDEMLIFSRGSLLKGKFVIETLSVPRYKFVDAIDNLGEQLRTKDDEELRKQYNEFNSLRRQVDHALCDII